jgi:hypothetical protein
MYPQQAAAEDSASSQIKGVLFDLDDTLIPSMYKSVVEAIKSAGKSAFELNPTQCTTLSEIALDKFAVQCKDFTAFQNFAQATTTNAKSARTENQPQASPPFQVGGRSLSNLLVTSAKIGDVEYDKGLQNEAKAFHAALPGWQEKIWQNVFDEFEEGKYKNAETVAEFGNVVRETWKGATIEPLPNVRMHLEVYKKKVFFLASLRMVSALYNGKN